MKEYGICMNDEMARAVFEGRKTMTRVPVKPKPPREGTVADLIASPYGQPGDRLWIQEAWRVASLYGDDRHLAIDYRASSDEMRTPWLSPPPETFKTLHAESIADIEAALLAGRGSVRKVEHGEFVWNQGDSPCRWRPSIHMPRWACRSVREIISVRVEPVQDISGPDGWAEGVDFMWDCEKYRSTSTVECFEVLWDSIYGTTEYAWANNPPVWVYEFRRVEA